MSPARRRKGAPAPFDRVRALVAAIPRGRVATYGQLSRLIDGRLTPVGVGWALHGASDGLPWHRVVNARGGISTEGHEPGLQRDLLEAEGVRFRDDATIDLARYQWKRGATDGRKPTRPRRSNQRRAVALGPAVRGG